MKLKITNSIILVLIACLSNAQLEIPDNLEKKLPNSLLNKNFQSNKAGTNYESLEYDESFNLIPWVDSELNFVPDESSKYAGDINGDGYDDFVKTSTKVSNEQTSDLGDYVNKTIITYGSNSTPFNEEIINTKIIPVGDLNNDDYDDAIGLHYDNTWQYYLGSSTGYIAHDTIHSTNTPNNIVGFADIDNDGYEDYINSFGFPNFKIIYGASTIDNIVTEEYSITPLYGPASDGRAQFYAGKINNSYNKIAIFYSDFDSVYCIIDSISIDREKYNIESFALTEMLDGYTLSSINLNIVDVDGDNFKEITWSGLLNNNCETYAKTDSLGSNLYNSTPILLYDTTAIPINDINNDGRCDFLISNSSYPAIALGPSDIYSGLTNNWSLNNTNISVFNFYEPEISDQFGDLNGDNYNDFYIEYDNETHFGDRIYFGNNTGDLSYNDIIYLKTNYQTNEIKQTVNVGDINNDGIDDIALLGDYKIQFFLDEIDLENPDFEITLEIEENLNFLKIIHGFFNNDEYNDIVILKSGFQVSEIDFYFGSDEFNTVLDHTIDILSVFSKSSSAVDGMSNIGDINNDDIEDLLIFLDNDVGIFYGQSTLSTSPDIILESKDLYYGGRTISLKDINSDGVDDFAISAYYTLNEIHVYFGQEASTSENITYEPDLILHPDTTGNKSYDLFGYGLTCGDFDGDGDNDIASLAYKTLVDQVESEPLMHIYYGGANMDSIHNLLLEIPTTLLLQEDAPFNNIRGGIGEFRSLPDLNNDETNEIFYGDKGWFRTNGLLINGGNYLVQDSIPAKIFIAPNQSIGLGINNNAYFSNLNSALGDFDGSNIIKLYTIQSNDKNYRSTPVYSYILVDNSSTSDTTLNAILNPSETNRDILVYPNPSDKFAYINLENIDSKEILIQICSLTGQVLFNKKVYHQTNIERIDISMLPKGFYIIKVKADNLLKTNKLYIK